MFACFYWGHNFGSPDSPRSPYNPCSGSDYSHGIPSFGPTIHVYLRESSKILFFSNIYRYDSITTESVKNFPAPENFVNLEKFVLAHVPENFDFESFGEFSNVSLLFRSRNTDNNVETFQNFPKSDFAVYYSLTFRKWRAVEEMYNANNWNFELIMDIY